MRIGSVSLPISGRTAVVVGSVVGVAAAVGIARALSNHGGSEAARGVEALNDPTPGTTPRPTVAHPEPTVPVPTEPPPVAPPTVPKPTGIAPGEPTTSRTGSSPIAAEYEQMTADVGVDAHSGARPDEFTQMHRTDGPGWLSSDGTLSTRLPDGRVMWIYGDTLIGQAQGGRITRSDGFMRNSIVVQDGNKRTTLIRRDAEGRAVGSIIAPGAGEWYWPGQPIVEGNTVKMTMGRVHEIEGTPGWNFEGAGTDIVTLDATDLSLKSIEPLNDSKEGSWGGNLFQDGEYTYMTGSKEDPEWLPGMVLGRAPKGELNAAHMEYWNGTAWTAKAEEAAPITHGTEGTFLKVDNGYALVTQGFPFGLDIFVQNAPSLTGPWTEPRKIAQIPTLPENSITYGAKVHPQYTADGQLLLSYNINRSDGKLTDELSNYRPGFISIPQSSLNPV